MLEQYFSELTHVNNKVFFFAILSLLQLACNYSCGSTVEYIYIHIVVDIHCASVQILMKNDMVNPPPKNSQLYNSK